MTMLTVNNSFLIRNFSFFNVSYCVHFKHFKHERMSSNKLAHKFFQAPIELKKFQAKYASSILSICALEASKSSSVPNLDVTINETLRLNLISFVIFQDLCFSIHNIIQKVLKVVIIA